MAKKNVKANVSEDVEVIEPETTSEVVEDTNVNENANVVASDKKSSKAEKQNKAKDKNAKADTKSDKSKAKNNKPKKERKSLKKRATEIWSELKKVSRPTFGQVVKNTCVVIAVVAICTVLLFGIDKLLSLIYELLLP